MDQFIYNYTSLKDREQKIYNFGETRLNGGQGVSVNTLLVVTPFVIGSVIIGGIVGKIFNWSYIPLSANFNLYHTIFWFAIGAIIGLVLYRCTFAGYRLYEYLLAYFRKKRVYAFTKKRTQVVHTNITINTFVRHML